MFRQEETSHQEAPERLHVVHEGDEGEGCCRVYTQGECRHQPNIGQAGKCFEKCHFDSLLNLFIKFIYHYPF